ncbi:SDR family oxidoreductase [Novosphingobium aquimarinum]|uniref:SDR family oxidoreductase n=1 Tax=Novosphingobium aquimarinum TaxID=2682494 RepID=UPI0012EB290D|nr:SDR family oxidoreductase [Novosphingobium aquimarinum]
MTDTAEMIHEDSLPGHESALEPKPEWQPRYPGSDRLKGKVAIITGADSGIGRAVAALYAREGAKVAIVYLLEDDDANETKRIVEGEGSAAILIKADVGSKKMCERIAEQTLEAFGRIDILVNNAGEQHPDEDITDITEEQLERTFQTNIFGMFYLVQAVRPHLEEGSAIINCTSVTMYKGSKNLLDYSATKGAITAFTRSLSENLISDGIRVNAVAPGPIWSPLNPCGGASQEKVEHFGEGTPIGRAGQPNEVAPSFLFLACEDASYMSGQVLHPNGGIVVNG